MTGQELLLLCASIENGSIALRVPLDDGQVHLCAGRKPDGSGWVLRITAASAEKQSVFEEEFPETLAQDRVITRCAELLARRAGKEALS